MRPSLALHDKGGRQKTSNVSSLSISELRLDMERK